MGRYICGDSILRLGKAGDHQPGEEFVADLSIDQEATLAAAGAIKVLQPSVPPPPGPAPWMPPNPPPPGPGADAPTVITTPTPPPAAEAVTSESNNSPRPTSQRASVRQEKE